MVGDPINREATMLDDALAGALNDQMNLEFASAHIYLAMSAHMDRRDLSGCAAWMRLQAEEETGHAMRFFDHVLDRGGQVRLGGIEAPPGDFGSPLETFERALGHERTVTAAIHALAERADRTTQVFLEWFITEQLEEERTVEQIVGSMRLAGDSGAALLILDRELGARRPAQADAPA
jgi:ferritin